MRREVVGAWDPEFIDQAIPLLQDTSRNRTRSDVDEPPVKLGVEALKVWRGENPKIKDTGEIDRSASLVKIGRVLFNAGVNRAVIVEALKERDATLGWGKYTNRRDNSERYDEIVDKLEANGRTRPLKVSRHEPAGGSPPRNANGHGASDGYERFNLTDMGNAERFVARHGEDARYCFLWGKWLVWTGARWERDDTGQVHRLAKETVRGIYQEAAAAEDEDRRKALARHATHSEAERKIKAMLELAKSEVPVAPDELDADPWRLNVPNGTVDLRTGELRSHRREDMLTRMAGAEYRPGAEAPTWAAFLERVLPGEQLREFVRRGAGYSATGDTSEQCMFINHGTGANGKSTFQEALAEALGDYAMRTPTEMLLAKRAGGVPNDVARLKGARFVAASETEENRRLAESLVKDLTGQDTISARFMRAEWFDFKPTHKLWLSTNHKPEIRGTDNAIWRRIRLVPWAVTIPPKEQDKKLPEKLRAELPGILAWIVRGCIEWRRDGLQAPEVVRKATGAYRAEMDVLAGFLVDCCEVGTSHWDYAKDLYASYKRWCDEVGERPESQRRFGGHLSERGFSRDRGGSRAAGIWRGVRLSEEEKVRNDEKLTLQKASISGDSDPTDPKNHINIGKSGSRGVMRKKGSVGSERSEGGAGNLAVSDVIEELENPASGPAKTAATYLAGETQLEYVVRSILFARRMDSEQWERHTSVVEAAVREWGSRE
jgi:P4 family phage/plasmid primase-like protien